MTKNCKICGKEFQTFPSSKKIYCSWDCYRKDPYSYQVIGKPLLDHICVVCGKHTFMKPHRAKIVKTCSPECAKKLRKPPLGADNPKWKGGYISKFGYHYQKIEGKYVLSHRLIYEQHYGIKIPKGYTVHHINGDRKDNRISNLQLMTIGEHTKHHNSKLTQKQKEMMDNLYRTGQYTHRELGQIYGIDKSQVSRILADFCPQWAATKGK